MTDENALTMPDAWLDVLHPRRDRAHVPEPPAPGADAPERVRRMVDAVRDDIEIVLDLPGTAPDLAAAARAHLGGEPDPVGAAVLAHVAGPLDKQTEQPVQDPEVLFFEALVAEHGVAFAAHAYTELAGIVQASPAHNGVYGARHRPTVAMYPAWGFTKDLARSLRARLAAAPGDVYADAAERLDGARRHDWQRALAAYLMPTREDWVEDLCANTPGLPERFAHAQEWLVFCALGGPHQLAAMGRRAARTYERDVVATLVDGLGPEAVVPLLAGVLDDRHGDRVALEFLGALPVDEAFQALVARIGRPAVRAAVLSAAGRFPARAARLLPASSARLAADVLSEHVRAHPAVAEEAARHLPAGQRAKVRAALDRLPPAADLPPLLAEPPWTRVRPKAKPAVLKNLRAPEARAVAWAPGERDDWAAGLPARWVSAARRIDAEEAVKVVEGTSRWAYGEEGLLLGGPEDLARPLLVSWEPTWMWQVREWLPALVARWELDARDLVLRVARRDPAGLGRYALPLLTDEIARTMADWLVRLKTAGKTARAWFRRHGAAAAPSLVPDALGKAGPARRAAEHALRHLAEQEGPDAVVAAARVHGDEAAAGVEALLAADPLDALPAKMPAVDWVDLRLLPQILLRDRTHALPDGAVRHVVTMLAMSKPGDVYAGVRIVRELCDPASLAEFGWALFRHWEFTGARPKENWPLTQLALTGDDETVRRLTPVIRAWPGEGGHAKAVTGLDVLTAIGTDTALIHLYSISQRVKFKGLKARAQEKIEELAAELELAPEQLADRLVPDFGLDASGTLTLDYGPRRFVIGFDELLRPTVADADGTPRKSLPKPGANDDPDLAPAAAKRFAALKKDVRTVASDQIGRLESAMLARRRWPVAEFREFLVAHPLVGHLVRRLVWLADDGDGDGDGGGGAAFRVAEDGTFADASDDAITLPGTAHVRVAHPVHLGDEVKAWSELFADYEILQPFEQLQRTVHTLAPGEREGGRLARFEGRAVEVAGLLGLTRRGWERGAPMEVGLEKWISRPVSRDRHLVLSLEPGFPVYDPYEQAGQILADVRLAHHPHEYGKGAGEPDLRLGDLDPVTVSEMLADLTALTSAEDATTR
ncbi:DUF4132 domain-containing protein [Actinomadura algeriensis]|uniref:DUF4132 domain-containing protein n=1 Tax=Actinomadura algeriensis TaxID=1679523 RepID=A0ABR9K381_9ACTN|nr:DUF4132 domain-containing protein [Actinomadura algeriensis]MBE1537272.1 hypothetical protein [Actinomadura algeriensis]